MSAFLDQFDADDTFPDVIIAEYAAQIAGGADDAGALAYVVEFASEEYDLSVAATAEGIRELFGVMGEARMNSELADAVRYVTRGRAVEVYKAEREAGATFQDASKAAGMTAPAMVQALKAERYSLSSETLATMNDANQEQHAVKGYEARQRLYGLMGRKLARVIRRADYSKMQPEKAIELLLRLAELTRDEKPPAVSVRIGMDRV